MELSVPEAMDALSRTPATLRGLLEGIPERWLGANEGDGTFSSRDVVGHLIHGEKTDWMPRAEQILGGRAGTPFPPFDRFAQHQDSLGKTLGELLEEFESLRAANLDRLQAFQLTEKDLDLKGTHPAFGSVSLRQLLATWVTHDLNHLAQVARVMASQYREAVGPWQAYLSILQRPKS